MTALKSKARKPDTPTFTVVKDGQIMSQLYYRPDGSPVLEESEDMTDADLEEMVTWVRSWAPPEFLASLKGGKNAG